MKTAPSWLPRTQADSHGRRADETAGQRQRVVAPDDLDRGAIVTVAEVGHEARDVDVGRAGAVARRRPRREAEPLRAGLPPDVALPLLAEMAQRAAERPRGRQPLRGELDRHRVERVEVRRIAATETDLGDQARAARQQPPHRGLFAVGELPVPVDRTPGLLDDADALGHRHEGGRRRHDSRGRERQRVAREIRLGERKEAAHPVVEDEQRHPRSGPRRRRPSSSIWLRRFPACASSTRPRCSRPRRSVSNDASRLRRVGEQQGDPAPRLRRVDEP